MPFRHMDDTSERIPGFEALKGLEVTLTGPARSRLARRCREEASRPAVRLFPAGWTARLFPLRAPLAVAAMGLVAVLAVGWMMTGRTGTDPQTAPSHEVRLVSVVPAGSGGVTLEWRDGNQRVYNVLKSTNPGDFKGAARYAVRGNRWTDTAPAPGEVVFYRVE